MGELKGYRLKDVAEVQTGPFGVDFIDYSEVRPTSYGIEVKPLFNKITFTLSEGKKEMEKGEGRKKMFCNSFYLSPILLK